MGEEALKDLFFSNVWCRMLPGAKIIERRFIIAGLFNHRTIIPAKGRLGPPGPGSPGRPGEGGTTYRMFLCVKSCYCGFLRGRRRNSHNGVKLILKKTEIVQNISPRWTKIRKWIHFDRIETGDRLWRSWFSISRDRVEYITSLGHIYTYPRSPYKLI